MNRAVYRHLLSTYGRFPSVWAGAALELARTVMLRVVLVIIMSQIAANLASGNVPAAKHYVVLFFIINISGALIGAAGELISLKAENAEYERLSVQYYLKLTSKDMAFYRDHQSGYLVGLFRQYLDGILLLVRFFRTDAIRIGVTLIFPAGVLMYMNLSLGLIALGVIIVQISYILWASSRTTQLRVRTHEIYRKVTGEVADVITNITAFKSSGAEAKARTQVRELAIQETQVFWERRKTKLLLDLPRDILTTLGVTAALLVVATSTTGSASVGLTVLTLTYMFQIVRNVNDLPNQIEQHDDFVSRAYPALQYLGREFETVSDPLHPKPLNVTRGHIELKHVSFSYPAGDRQVKVFHDLNIDIKPGEHIGIVGLSGAGKSTLASLLLRFDDVDEGAICVDGLDIRQVAQTQLRQQIAYVPQEPLLFHRTIRDNIAYFDERATNADVIRAAEAAHAHHFITQLPEGYDSMAGERGVKLSGGQKQRVVIARSILKNAPIMLFDEATSALDSESERIIQRALPEIIGRHTAIVIAHRLSTVASLDRILVMHDGAIEEQGTHEQLLLLGGRYASLWAKQTGKTATSTA
jgi:ATP-binding cassette subfamily B protein